MKQINNQVVKEFMNQPGLTNIPVWFILSVIDKYKFTETDELTDNIKRRWGVINGCKAYLDEGLVKSLLFMNGYDLFLLSGQKVDRTKTVINDMTVKYEKSFIL